MKAIIVGDLQFRNEKPFLHSIREFFEWFIKQDFNNEENIFIQLGDWTEKAKPNPKVIMHSIDFLQSVKCHKKYIIAGNHDYQRNTNSYSIDAFRPIENVECITYPRAVIFNDKTLLMLPYIYDNTIYPKYTMKEVYEDLDYNEFLKDEYHVSTDQVDYLFGHFNDRDLFGYEINIDYIKCKKFLGHVHLHNEDDNYAGVPVITRYDERNSNGIKTGFIYIIDLETDEIEKVKVPNFLDYINIDYEDIDNIDEIIENSNIKWPIIDICNVPNKQLVEELKNKYDIRQIHLKEDKKEKEQNEIESNLELKEYFELFCKNEGVDKIVKDTVLQYTSF